MLYIYIYLGLALPGIPNKGCNQSVLTLCLYYRYTEVTEAISSRKAPICPWEFHGSGRSTPPDSGVSLFWTSGSSTSWEFSCASSSQGFTEL